MTGFEQIVVALADVVPAHHAGIEVTDLLLDVPVETRFSAEGLIASLPRGLLATGFDPSLSRVRLTFVARGAA